MFNLYVHSNSFSGATVGEIENSLKELNEIVANGKDYESFWKNEHSLYNVQVAEGEYLSQIIWSKIDAQFRISILPKLLNSIREANKNYATLADFDQDYTIFNAFYGISFTTPCERYTHNQAEYNEFLKNCIEHELSPQDVPSIAGAYLPNLTFNPQALTDLSHITDHGLFMDILQALLQVNSSNKEGWKRGYYDYKSLPIRISGESESTMNDPVLQQSRYFMFADGKKRCCELHIKINRNAYRVHICPENHKIYVGYIGPHLPTSRS